MAHEQADPLAPHPERDVVLDTAVLRVLAHPMRLSFLHYLRDHGPATGRRLARTSSSTPERSVTTCESSPAAA